MEDATKRITPLNAYALDFYKHGQEGTLMHDNMMRRRVWDTLKDWSLALKTIETTLKEITTATAAAVRAGTSNLTEAALARQKCTLDVWAHLCKSFSARFENYQA